MQEVAREQDPAVFAGEFSDELADLALSRRVESVRGFVEDHERRIRKQRGGDAESLAHAERVGSKLRSTALGEPQSREQGVHPRERAAAPQDRDRREVVAAGEIRIEGSDLEHRSDAGERVLASHANVASEYLSRSRGRRDEPEDHADRRALPRAVRAEKTDDLAAPDLEIEPVHGGDRSESFHESLGAEDDLVRLDRHGPEHRSA